MSIRVKKKITIMAPLVSLTLIVASCSMMKDDRTDCPDCRNPLHVTLRYDYNTMRANMFSDHVEEATVYVVDAETGNVVDQQTAQNSTTEQPLRNPSFGFNFEGLTPGNYRLYATGRSQADQPFNIVTPAIAEAISKLQFSVPVSTVNGLATEGTQEWSTADGLRLDTLWNTLQPIDIVLPESEPVEATIPLMRLTNDLNVMVFHRDTPADNGHERYDVSVTDETTKLSYDNEPAAGETASLTYRPFAAWTTETTVPGNNGTDSIAERNAHYDLSLFRLISHSDTRHNPRLIISNRETGREVVNVDLCYYLALARNAYELQHYSQQEYLDREYDYRLDFGFEGSGNQEKWKTMTISINVLSWSIRIQNEEL